MRDKAGESATRTSLFYTINPVDKHLVRESGLTAVRRTRRDRKHSSSRERLLREIEVRGSASVGELAHATELHENTVRGHLDRLSGDGYLRSERVPSVGRGRPSTRWYPVRAEVRDPYAGLAIALAETLAEAGPGAAALMRTAGHAWGARLAAERQMEQCQRGQQDQRGQGGTQDRPDQQDERRQQSQHDQRGAQDPQDPAVKSVQSVPSSTADIVFEVMREQGFAPEQAGEQLLLHDCPILAAAKGNPEVVCAAHRGMVEGLIQANGDTAEVELQPFAAPNVCALQLKVAS